MAKRKHVLRSILVLMLLFGIVGVAGAQGGLPNVGWFTSATIQNVGTEAATVTLDVYGTSGSPSTGTTQIAVGGNKVFLPGSGNTATTVDVTPALGQNFIGSMVVNSTQPVVAIGQVGNNRVGGLGTEGGRASAQFRGSEAAANTISYPVVKNGFGGVPKTTIFSIQAAGANVNYTATINANNGVSYTKTGAIEANRSVTLIPADFRNGNTPMPSNCGTNANTGSCIGSLTVAGNNPIVGAVVETVSQSAGPATIAQATSLFASSDAGKNVFCPVFKNAHGANRRYGGITVQNVGTAATTVQINLTESLVASPRNWTATSPAIPAGGSYTFLGSTNNVGGMPQGTLASAELIAAAANGSIIAVASESNFEAAISAQKATTFSCFAGATATSKVAFPVVKERFGDTLSTTGLSIQNVGTVAATANVSFVCTRNGAPQAPFVRSTGALAPGASITFVEPGRNAGDEAPGSVPNGSLCAVTATGTTANDKIVGLANESSDFYVGLANQGTLDTKNYEGFNLAQ